MWVLSLVTRGGSEPLSESGVGDCTDDVADGAEACGDSVAASNV